MVKILLLGLCLMSRLLITPDILIGYSNTIWIVPQRGYYYFKHFPETSWLSFKCSPTAKIPANIWTEVWLQCGSTQRKTMTPPSLTADIQLQLGSAATSLIEGVAPVGARVWSTDSRDGKRGGELVTPGTGQDVWCERLFRFLQSKQTHRA